MACNKVLLAALVLAVYGAACWAVVVFLPLCPIPTSDAGSSASSGSSDAEECFCVPDIAYAPRGWFHVAVAGYLGWFAVNIYKYFAAAADEAIRAAVARKMLVMAALIVGNILVVVATVPSFLPLHIPYLPEDTVSVLLGCLMGRASTKIYNHFVPDDGDMDASCDAVWKAAAYLGICDDLEAGGGAGAGGKK